MHTNDSSLRIYILYVCNVIRTKLCSPLFIFCFIHIFIKNLIWETELSRPADAFNAHPNREKIKLKNSFSFENRMQNWWSLMAIVKPHVLRYFDIHDHWISLSYSWNLIFNWDKVLLKLCVNHVSFNEYQWISCDKIFGMIICYTTEEILEIYTRANYSKNNFKSSLSFMLNCDEDTWEWRNRQEMNFNVHLINRTLNGNVNVIHIRALIRSSFVLSKEW